MDCLQLPCIRVEEAVSWTQRSLTRKFWLKKSKFIYDKLVKKKDSIFLKFFFENEFLKDMEICQKKTNWRVRGTLRNKLNQIEFLTMLKEVQTSQTEADVDMLFIMATWVGKMELSCRLCVHKKIFLWQRNT